MEIIYTLLVCLMIGMKAVNCEPDKNTTAAPTTVPTTAPTTVPTTAPTTASTTASTTVPTTAPTTASTTAPITATTAAPVVTTAPPSNPKNYTFHVLDSTNNSSCIIADMGTRFTFNISGQEEVIDLQMKAPVNNVDGSCNNTTQTMNITFTVNKVSGDMWMFLTFTQSSGSFQLESVSVGYSLANSKRVASSNSSHYNVKAQLGRSYLCKSGITIDDFQPNELHSVYFSQMQVEAFRKPGLPDTFSQASSCENDAAVNQLVPIIVGAALAGLVIIVLIAYLVGRARNRRAGYESV